MKRLFLPFFLFISGLILTGCSLTKTNPTEINKKPENQTTTAPSPIITTPDEKGIEISPISEEDIVRRFFELVNEKQIPAAIGMMSVRMAPDDSVKQAWGVQFNDIESISATEITPHLPEEWTDNRHSYKVMLNVNIAPDAVNAPIPYYGWGDNPNVRWVALTKNDGGNWEIDEIATGP